MKFLKYFFIAVIIIAVGGILYYFIANEPLPEATESREAGLTAIRMLDAVHFADWQKTTYVSWTFREKQHYIWDKKNNVVQVKWDDIEVVFNTVNLAGMATKKGETLLGMDRERMIKKAWKNWVNASFWLNAPAKVMEAGASLKITTGEDSSKQLLVTYNSGGIHAGDSYLWKLDENNLPQSFKMWTADMPLGGTEASFEGWTALSTGALIATKHKTDFSTVEISNLKDAQSLSALGLDEAYFKAYY